MTTKTVLNPLGFNSAATCRIVKQEKKHSDKPNDYILAIFPRARWILFKNFNYYEDVESTQNEKNKYYKSVSSIPKYHIHKNNKKISIALPRLDVHGNGYLYIPRGIKVPNTGTGKALMTYPLKKEFYIFDIDEEYNINDKADIVF
jgi:hypothetical protein